MPATEHLRWFEVSKFKGLWTNGGKFLMPADHAQVMSGCLPQKAGGLRAFYTPTSERDATGLVQSDPAYTRTVRGFGLMADPFTLTGNYYYLIISNGANDFGLWSRSSAPIASVLPIPTESTWDRKTSAVRNGTAHTPGRPYMVTFSHFGWGTGLSGGEQYMTSSHNWLRASPPRTYHATGGNAPHIVPVDLLVSGTQLDCGPVTTHQSRVVLGAENGILAGAPGDIQLSPAPVQIVAEQAGTATWVNSTYPLVAWLLSIPPSDLLVGMLGGAVYNIQGDLADPTIRELGRWGPTAPQQPVNTPYGPVVIFPRMGPTIMGTDGSIQNIGEPLDPASWEVDLAGEDPYFGCLVFSSGYLFAPNLVDATASPTTPTVRNNGALVYDFSTGAWFTSAHPEVRRTINPRFMATSSSRYNGGVFVATGETLSSATLANHTIISRYPLSGAGYYYDGASLQRHITTRSPRFEWTSAPFRDPDGRQTEVQEIQLGTLGWSSDSTVIVTVRGNTGEVATVTASVPLGRATHRLPIRLRADYVEVTIKSINNIYDGTPEGEAPMIDFIRVGYQPGQRR